MRRASSRPFAAWATASRRKGRPDTPTGTPPRGCPSPRALALAALAAGFGLLLARSAAVVVIAFARGGLAALAADLRHVLAVFAHGLAALFSDAPLLIWVHPGEATFG